MTVTTIQAIEARQNLGEILERVYYQNKIYRIARKDKPMGWLVSDEFVETFAKLASYIVEREPILADTLAVTLDGDIRSIIEEGRSQWTKGERLSLEEALE